MTPDTAAAALKALALPAVFQAAGGSIFLRGFGQHLGRSEPLVRHLVLVAAIGAIALLIAHECVEAARLSGDFSGVWDPDLERIAWASRGGVVHAVQVLGLLLITGALALRTQWGRTPAAVGAMVTMVAFAGAGHTSIHSLRAMLTPLLLIHVLVGAFWFGSLGPLLILVRCESSTTACRVLASFSGVAGWLVPCLGLAGLVIAAVLVPEFSVYTRPYGALLALKMAVFGLLLMLAAYNRWRFVPALAAGRAGAAKRLTRSIECEIALITTALAAAAILTTCCSPED